METAPRPASHREPLRIVVAGGVLAFVGVLVSLVPLLGGFLLIFMHGDYFSPGPPLRDALIDAVLIRLVPSPLYWAYGVAALCLALALGLYRGATWGRWGGLLFGTLLALAGAALAAVNVLSGPERCVKYSPDACLPSEIGFVVLVSGALLAAALLRTSKTGSAAEPPGQVQWHQERALPRRHMAAAGFLGVLALLGGVVPATFASVVASVPNTDSRTAANLWLAAFGALIVAGLTTWVAFEARSVSRRATWFGPPLAVLAGLFAPLSLLLGTANLPIGIVLVAMGILGLVGVPYVAWALWSTRGSLGSDVPSAGGRRTSPWATVPP